MNGFWSLISYFQTRWICKILDKNFGKPLQDLKQRPQLGKHLFSCIKLDLKFLCIQGILNESDGLLFISSIISQTMTTYWM